VAQAVSYILLALRLAFGGLLGLLLGLLGRGGLACVLLLLRLLGLLASGKGGLLLIVVGLGGTKHPGEVSGIPQDYEL